MDRSPSRLRRAAVFAAWTAALGWLLAAPFAGPVRAAAPQDALTVTITPKDVWPPAPVADLKASAGAEGQILLSWSAPDSNNNVFAASSPAAGYSIRIATFSVAGVGGSTTVWWNGAVDVLALSAPASPVAPPTPAFPGTTQYLLINQLWPGVTYYAMIVSSDAAGNVSGADLNSIPPAVQASTRVYDAPPPAPAALSAVAVGTSSFNVSWSSVAAFDLWYYKLYVDSVAPNDFSHAFTLQISSALTSTQLAGLGSGVYALRLSAVDRGAPAYPGAALEGAFSPVVVATLTLPIRLPQAPYGIALTSAGAATTLRWLPVVRYDDFTPFAVSSAPDVNELGDYRVYRATTPVLGGWSEMAVLSTATLSWTDAASGPQYYYHVKAENSTGFSARSAIRTGGTKSAYIVAPDDRSYFEIGSSDVGPIEGVPSDPDSAFLIQVSSRPQDLGGLNGRVMKSLEFDAYMGGRLLSDFVIAGRGLLRLRYELAASSAVAPSSAFALGVAPTPGNMSVYWHNGRTWVQLYGALDGAAQMVTIQTKFLGRYQLRAVERTGGFAFNQAGVSNRFLTPNGDGKNDDVVFTFDNPRDSAVVGKILDMHGKVIVAGLPPGPVSNSLAWDGTAGGRVVPGGVYIYVIQAEGRSFSGTVVVIR